MKPPDFSAMSRLLLEHPLPWTAIRDFDGAGTGQSYILDANSEQVMRITTGIKTHRKVIDLLMYLIPDKMPELNISDSRLDSLTDAEFAELERRASRYHPS